MRELPSTTSNIGVNSSKVYNVGKNTIATLVNFRNTILSKKSCCKYIDIFLKFNKKLKLWNKEYGLLIDVSK